MVAEGGIATSLARPMSRGVTVDCKAMLMVDQFRKYQMKIFGISET